MDLKRVWLLYSRSITNDLLVEHDLHMLRMQKKLRKIYDNNVYKLNRVIIRIIKCLGRFENTTLVLQNQKC